MAQQLLDSWSAPSWTGLEGTNWLGLTSRFSAARVFTRLTQWFCGLRGHATIRCSEGNHLMLRCMDCGHTSPGWRVGRQSIEAMPRGQEARARSRPLTLVPMPPGWLLER